MKESDRPGGKRRFNGQTLRCWRAVGSVSLDFEKIERKRPVSRRLIRASLSKTHTVARVWGFRHSNTTWCQGLQGKRLPLSLAILPAGLLQRRALVAARGNPQRIKADVISVSGPAARRMAHQHMPAD